MTGAIKILRIEVDGHFHGSSEVPRPWVAQITGVDPKYGLARAFVERLNDWRRTKRACSGNLYGVVAAFPLRAGNVYEVSRLRGKPSKRYVSREFLRVDGNKLVPLSDGEAIDHAEQHAAEAIDHRVRDGVSISRVDRIGSTEPCGFVLCGRDRSDRLFRLRRGAIHEVDDGTARWLILVGDDRDESPTRISQREALDFLRVRAGMGPT